jgi:hypothetical protein
MISGTKKPVSGARSWAWAAAPIKDPAETPAMIADFRAMEVDFRFARKA